MVRLPIIWLSYHEGIDAIGPWDTRILVDLFDGSLFPHCLSFHSQVFTDPAPGWRNRIVGGERDRVIVVLPARHHANDVPRLNDDLAQFDSVLLILCGDEDARFPWRELSHPNLRLWVQMPDPSHYAGCHGFFFGNGSPAQPRHYSNGIRDTPWMFSGQDTHQRRHACVEMLKQRTDAGFLIPTGGFGQGMPPGDYARQLAATWICPAPAGPRSVDTFRAYEALEAGAIPIVEAANRSDQQNYWTFVYGSNPLPTIENWERQGSDMIDRLYADRYYMAAVCSAWWQQQKMRMARQLENEALLLGMIESIPTMVTAIVSTSPVPATPSITHLKATVDSIRDVFGERTGIIIACDGVRPEQAEMEPLWNQARLAICDFAARYPSIVPYISPEWKHQALLARTVLDHFALEINPVLLFCEHDTPLVTDWPIDVDGCVEYLRQGVLDMIRFHHEALILPDHEHLMVDHDTVHLWKGGAPVRRTIQWSQRPHLATTNYYRNALYGAFTETSRTMIEDKMHSVCQTEPWTRNRLAIYHPDAESFEGNIKRSYHLDARGDAPKFDMRF